ncbi:MAG TPA: hypothetical protein VGR65_11795 [Casimicrobiaceae bacterium]|nr:hypothetical protein [Casimicrobiaceae bacterium]
MSRPALIQRSPVQLDREWTLKGLSPKQHAPLLDHAVSGGRTSSSCA